MPFSITNKTRQSTPRVPFELIKNKVLNKNYELSLVFCGDALSRKLSRTYRNKDKATNVLSFPLTKNSGEIFINLSQLSGFSVEHLYIHGLLHLKGMEHGAKMTRAEKSFVKRFLKPKNGATNNSGH